MYEHELYHHGILGQKWGIRRYQRKDGTLTSAGKRRRAKLESEYAKLNDKDTAPTEYGARRKSKISEEYQKITGKSIADTYAESKKRSISSMTDDQLRNITARNVLETNYINSQNNLITAKTKYAELTSPKPKENAFVNELKRSMSKTAVSTLEQSIKDTGKAVTQAMLNDGGSETKKMQKMQKDIAKYKAAVEKGILEEKVNRLNKDDKTTADWRFIISGGVDKDKK